MVDPRRVCEVYALPACGSATVLGGGLVLTARHVLAGRAVGDGEVQVRLGDGAVRVCVVAWLSSSWDVALVRVIDPPDWVARLDVPGLGMLACSRAGVSCEAVGFPDVTVDLDQVRNLHHLAGVINPLSRLKAGLFDVELNSAPPTRAGEGGPSPWSGMSGAGVFSHDLLTGVVVHDPPGWASSRLSAVPVAVLAGDETFRAAVWPDALANAWPGCDPVELARLQAPPIVPASPASLLRADAEVVEFHGRIDVLAQLHQWRAGGAARSATLITGAGGQGKTRLARRFGQEAARDGWAVLHLARVPLADDYDWLVSVTEPLLIVVDYAEQRPEQLRILATALAGHGRATPVRLLMLARADGDWHLLPAELDFAKAAPAHALPPLDRRPTDKVDTFRDSVAAFADRLAHLPSYTHVNWTALVSSVPAPDLTGETTALSVQIHALVGLLQQGHRTEAPDGSTLQDILNSHEARYWTDTARTHGLTFAAATQRAAVAAACLLPAASLADAQMILSTVPGIRDATEDRRSAAAEWVHGLYPQPPLWWGSLQPDLLAEYLIGASAREHPQMLAALLATANIAQVTHALTLLAQASAHQPHLATQLAEVVAAQPAALTPIAITVVTQSPNREPLEQAIDNTIDMLRDDRGTLATIADAFRGIRTYTPNALPIACCSASPFGVRPYLAAFSPACCVGLTAQK